MLVVSNQRYLPSTINTIVLQKDDLYFYVHRDVYDQSVILSDRYPSPEPLLGELGLEVGSDKDKIIMWSWDKLPRPINILSPFLYLVEGDLDEDLETVCGALHVITSSINARNFIKMPREIRKSVSFSLSIKEEYELSWERFFMEAIPYDQRNRVAETTYSASIQQVDTETPPVTMDAQGNFVFYESEDESMESYLAEMGLGTSSEEETEVPTTTTVETTMPQEEVQETRRLLFRD